MKSPGKYTLYDLVRLAAHGANFSEDGKLWHPARPISYSSFKRRVKYAYLVFTGKCDAVEWPGDQ